MIPYLSVVIPVYNEQGNLIALADRLVKTLESIGKPYEIIFVDDGSEDQSLAILESLQSQFPKVIGIVDFQGNYGQHMAIIAGFEQCRGNVIVTLDADLQNPPEEIPRLVEEFEKGNDYVGSYRDNRKDGFFRRWMSKGVNALRESITDIQMQDQGCMLRAYSRPIVDQIIASKERSAFIPALAYQFSHSPTEIQVHHEARVVGSSKYNLYKLIRLNFDLITGFSLVPLQIFTILGMVISFCSAILVIYMIVRRVLVGPEAEGVFTLFAIVFFLISVVIMGIGLIGEYLGRIFQNINQRPRFCIRKVLPPLT